MGWFNSEVKASEKKNWRRNLRLVTFGGDYVKYFWSNNLNVIHKYIYIGINLMCIRDEKKTFSVERKEN